MSTSMYAIRLNKLGKYLDWYNGCWYASSEEPIHKFTLDEAHEMAKKLRECYIYNIDIVNIDNKVVENINAFKKEKPVVATKHSGFNNLFTSLFNRKWF